MEIKSAKLIDKPLVSVIIPSFNRPDTIGKTIDAILEQVCNFKFEIIIGDDCSISSTREILLRYQEECPENFVLYMHENNIGLGANWALCVQQCRGKYVAGCDNDDYWHSKTKLQDQIDFLEEHLDYGVVHTNYRTLNRESGLLNEIEIHDSNYSEKLILEIFKGNFKCCNSSVVYRKSVLDKYVNLNDYINLKFTLQDWNTWILIANFTQFKCLPISTTTVGVETESITRPKEYEQILVRFEREKFLYKYLCDLFPHDLIYDEKNYDRYVYHLLLNLAYRRCDAQVAKKYSRLLFGMRNKSFKSICGLSSIPFYLFYFAQKLKAKVYH